MTNEFDEKILDMNSTAPEPEDYTGEDGLLYCGRCRKSKEAYFPEGKRLFGRDRYPSECDCQRAEREKREAGEASRRHLEEVENIGLLLWGRVGTGKSYFAGCIANALMEMEVPVCMTNFTSILNDLAARFEGRNEYISRLCSFPLLILDDFGMERGTEYSLEQVYNVIDSRYHSGRPLIVTTNLTLEELQYPKDTAHARIYDRLLAMCYPICFTGENFRKGTAQEKMERLKELLEKPNK